MYDLCMSVTHDLKAELAVLQLCQDCINVLVIAKNNSYMVKQVSDMVQLQQPASHNTAARNGLSGSPLLHPLPPSWCPRSLH